MSGFAGVVITAVSVAVAAGCSASNRGSADAGFDGPLSSGAAGSGGRPGSGGSPATPGSPGSSVAQGVGGALGGGRGGSSGSGGTGTSIPSTPTETCRKAIEVQCARGAFSEGNTTLEKEIILQDCSRVADNCPDYYFAPDSNRTVENVSACLDVLATRPLDDISLGIIFPSCLLRASRHDLLVSRATA